MQLDTGNRRNPLNRSMISMITESETFEEPISRNETHSRCLTAVWLMMKLNWIITLDRFED